jgi:hypothetical protein
MPRSKTSLKTYPNEHLCIVAYTNPEATRIPWEFCLRVMRDVAPAIIKSDLLVVEPNPGPVTPRERYKPIKMPLTEYVAIVENCAADTACTKWCHVRNRNSQFPGSFFTLYAHDGAANLNVMGCVKLSIVTAMLQRLTQRDLLRILNELFEELHKWGHCRQIFCDVGLGASISEGDVYGLMYCAFTKDFYRGTESCAWDRLKPDEQLTSLRGVYPITYVSSRLIAAEKIAKFVPYFNKMAKSGGLGKGAVVYEDGSAMFWCVKSPMEMAFEVNPDSIGPSGALAAILRKWLHDEGLLKY